MKFAIFTGIFFAILVHYVLFRANWLQKEKAKYPNRTFKMGYDQRIWMFWVWDIKKLTIKKGRSFMK